MSTRNIRDSYHIDANGSKTIFQNYRIIANILEHPVKKMFQIFKSEIQSLIKISLSYPEYELMVTYLNNNRLRL